MPFPKPKPRETEEEFVERFISDEEMIEEYPEEEQRIAIAYDTFRKKTIDKKKYENIDFKPTKQMAANAKRGLKMREEQPESNRCCTRVGLARANQLIKREELSPDIVKRMYSFFSRHEVDKESESWEEGNSKGEQAWLIWGGDAGYKWSERKVEQMDKEDEEKGGDTLNIENKSMELKSIEIKKEGDKGIFKAYLNTYGNIDLGADITEKSFGDANVGKKIPLLKEHSVGTEHGVLEIDSDDKGIIIKGELYLEKIDGTDLPVFPQAHKTYSLLKRGVNKGVPVKFSMGYIVTKKKMDTQDGIRVRRLIDGEIKEGSIVTFPMNPKAVQTSQVKAMGGEMLSDISVKTDMATMMAMEDAEEKMNKMRWSFFRSCDETMRDDSKTLEEKMMTIRNNMAFMSENYPKACMKVMSVYHDENGQMKNDLDGIDIKSIEELEAKAGKKFSKSTKNKLMDGLKMIKEGYESIGKMIEEDVGDDGDDPEDDEEEKAIQESLLQLKNFLKDEGGDDE